MGLNNYLILGLWVNNTYSSAVSINIVFVNIRLNIIKPQLLSFPLKTGRRRVVYIVFKKRQGFIIYYSNMLLLISFLFSHLCLLISQFLQAANIIKLLINNYNEAIKWLSPVFHNRNRFWRTTARYAQTHTLSKSQWQ